jgi:sec-independent protein translocase protein TatA
MYTGTMEPVMLLSMPGGTEWIFIILAVIILFGGKKIPELAKGLGKGIRDFKDAKEGLKEETDKAAGEMNMGERKEVTG